MDEKSVNAFGTYSKDIKGPLRALMSVWTQILISHRHEYTCAARNGPARKVSYTLIASALHCGIVWLPGPNSSQCLTA
jgi:hypothetical protein